VATGLMIRIASLTSTRALVIHRRWFQSGFQTEDRSLKRLRTLLMRYFPAALPSLSCGRALRGRELTTFSVLGNCPAAIN